MTAAAETATGFDGQITQAVTPTFSRDGKRRSVQLLDRHASARRAVAAIRST